MGKISAITLDLNSSQNKYTYAKEKLSQAVHELATGEGDVRFRLTQAYLFFHMLTPMDFPKDLRSEWEGFLKQLCSKGHYKGPDGRVMLSSVQNTMRHIRNSSASRLAGELVTLHSKLAHYA